jgi:Uncharacterised nucleotidyltransferase
VESGYVSYAAHATARNLRVDDATAQVLRAFDGAGVPSILLKGPSIVRWLYEKTEPRWYVDADVLVAPHAMDDAERVLTGLGYVPDLEQCRMPPWWREHAVGWLHREEGVVIDLHGTLTGAGVDAARVWSLLSAHTDTMIVGGFPAAVLSLPGRALHLALHAAQHGEGRRWGGVLIDLERGLARAGEQTWREAARLASELHATAAFAAGLRLVPEGRVLAARMELPQERPVEVALRSASAPAQALTFDRLARATGVRERLGIVRHKLVPPRTFMRSWSALARRGRAGLLLAYGQRLVWLARSAPGGFRVWHRARRDAQRESPGGGS